MVYIQTQGSKTGPEVINSLFLKEDLLVWKISLCVIIYRSCCCQHLILSGYIARREKRDIINVINFKQSQYPDRNGDLSHVYTDGYTDGYIIESTVAINLMSVLIVGHITVDKL